MESINAEWRFNGVGQGLFYTGIIVKKGSDNKLSKFITVYDCGTLNKGDILSNEIDVFVKSLPDSQKKIDLLTISHFDKDHINGLPKLLKKFKTVDTVVIPYLSTYQKAVYISTIDSSSPPEIFELYRDPIEFFVNRKVKNIVVIMGSDEDKNIRDAIHVQGTITYEELQTERGRQTTIMYAHNQISLKSTDFKWNFHFFNKGSFESINPNTLNELKKIVDSSSIGDIFFDRVKLNEIKKLYKMIDEINDTSVVLFHHPVNEGIMIPSNSIWWYLWCLSCNTILTGDLNCNKYKDEVSNWLKTLLPSCDNLCHAIVSVPHHGSQENWHEWLTNYFKKSIFVIPYGIANQFGHPAFKVKMDICENGHIPVEATQRQGFAYSISLKIKQNR